MKKLFMICCFSLLSVQSSLAGEASGAPNQAPAQTNGAQQAIKAGAATGNPDEVGGSGIVRHVRENPVPQVFFNELNGAFLIQDGLEYAKFYGVLTTSMRSKKPVSFVYNKKTMRIVSVEGSFSKDTQVYEDAPIDLVDDKKDGAQGKSHQTPTEQKQSIDDFLKTIDTPKK